MPYIAPEVVQEAKRMDLLTYLKNYEPYELVHFSGNTYTTKTHDSLKISNGKWMWWSRGIGGRSAVDYLIKVRDYTFMEAVQTIAGQAAIAPPVSLPAEKTTEKKLLLPKPNRYQTQVVSYLNRRGIDTDIIEFCLQKGMVFESENYHNAVFVGMDKGGKPRYAALRGIGTDFIGDANGSDKNYSLEQLRTIDKKRLDDYVGALDRQQMLKVERALCSSTGMRKLDKPILMCLCPVCAKPFFESREHFIQRTNKDQKVKETCMFCNTRQGYDYYIRKKYNNQ